MRIARPLLVCFFLLALAVPLACGSSPQPSAGEESKSSAPALPAGWKTFTNDNKTCSISLPPTWVEAEPGSGMFGPPAGKELAVFMEDEVAKASPDWSSARAEVAGRQSLGAKGNITEESANAFRFEYSEQSARGILVYRRTAETVCMAQILVPADDGLWTIARQIADSLQAFSAPAAPAQAAAAAPSALSPPPADWVTVTNDAKTCRLSLPPAWVSPDSDGIWGRMDQGEMAMFVEDEETQQAGNWGPVHRMIEKRRTRGAKVEILEETPERIIFQAPHGSILAMMSFRRSPRTLCAVQIGVAAGDPEQVKTARQIAESLATLP